MGPPWGAFCPLVFLPRVVRFWIKFQRLVQNDMSIAVMWSKSKPEFQYGRRLGEFNGILSQNHLPHCRVLPHGEWNVMIPELRATLQGAAIGRIQWHVIQEPRITLQGAATWWTHCHDSRETCHIAWCSHLAKSMSWSCHIAGCKNSIRHIENRFSPYFIIFLFLEQFRLWWAMAFVSSPIHLFVEHWDMAISWFSRWRIFAILNFKGLVVGSLKSPCRTSYRLSTETTALNCLVFEKIAFCTHFGDRRTDRRTSDGQPWCIKALSLSPNNCDKYGTISINFRTTNRHVFRTYRIPMYLLFCEMD